MTRADRWENARFELVGAAAVLIVVSGLELAVDPDGWLWSLVLGAAPVVLGVTAVYAAVVWRLRRRA